MRRLHLNFETGHAGRTAGRALLVAGVLAAAVGGYRLLTLNDEIEAWQAKTADLQRLSERRLGRVSAGAAVSPETAGQVRRANQILRQMTVPWDDLFRELETASGKDIALLAIEPDAQTGQLRIVGEAKDVDAMLAYTGRLERNALLADVFVTGHEMKRAGTQTLVGFTVSANWRVPS